MTQDEIIRMAREAGAEFYAETLCVNGKDAHDFIERFAAIVAAHEREKAKVVFEELEREVKAELINAINGAVELEREACAKVCEEVDTNNKGFPLNAKTYTAAIRARREK